MNKCVLFNVKNLNFSDHYSLNIFTFNRGKLIIKDKYKKLMRSNPDTRYISENDYVWRRE